MKAFAFVLLVFLTPLHAENASDPIVDLRVSADYPASLFYAIDQLSQWRQPYRKYYHDFWKKQFGITEEDDKLLQTYKEIRQSYSQRVGRKYAGDPAPVTFMDEALDLSDQWPLIFSGCKELGYCWERAEILVSNKDLTDLKIIFAHFDRKFYDYWHKRAAVLGKAVKEFRKEGWERKLADHFGDIAKFYELKPSVTHRFYLTFVWQPDIKSSGGQSNASLYGSSFVVQIPEDAGWRTFLDVIAHEMIHAIFRVREPSDKAKIQYELLNQDNAAGLLAVQGLDEGLATALGNGLFTERYRPSDYSFEKSWYDDPAVDFYAKAIYPELKAAFTQGTNLSAFGPKIISLLKNHPKFIERKLPEYFRNCLIVVNTASSPLAFSWIGEMSLGGSSVFFIDYASHQQKLKETLAAHSAAPVVVILEPSGPWDSLTQFADLGITDKELAEFKTEAQNKPGIWVRKNKSGRLSLLISGKIDQLQTALPNVSKVQGIPEGILFP